MKQVEIMKKLKNHYILTAGESLVSGEFVGMERIYSGPGSGSIFVNNNYE